GVGAVVGSSRTNGQRPGLRFVRKCPIGDPAFKMRLLRDLEEDVVPSRLRAEVHAALETRVEDKYATFARCAPAAERRWQAAILPREARFGGFVKHRPPPPAQQHSLPTAVPEPVFHRQTAPANTAPS